MPSPSPRVSILHLRTDRPGAPGFQAELDALNTATCKVVDALGWSYQLVATAERPPEETLNAARDADMIVLMGGEDVDPRLYSQNDTYPGSGHHEPRADGAQIAVVLEAVRRGTPLLGICRGLQLLNVALGGTLIQHLPGDRHRSVSAPDDPFVASRVLFEPDGASLDPGSAVLCTHHQAIDELGKGLRAVAYSEDGVIEAVVHESAPTTGVQWHPEHPRTAATQLRALLLRMERQLARV